LLKHNRLNELAYRGSQGTGHSNSKSRSDEINTAFKWLAYATQVLAVAWQPTCYCCSASIVRM